MGSTKYNRRIGAARYPRQRRRDEWGIPPCTYCGLPADTKDHIVPLAVLAKIECLSDEVRDEILGELPPLITVHSCRQCNQILGSRMFRTLGERRKFVKEHLRKKYGRVLNAPYWTDEEKDELGHTLRDFIEKRQLLKETIRERLSWR